MDSQNTEYWEAIEKTTKLWTSFNTTPPPPRLVWMQKVWTLRLGSDTQSISDRILIGLSW